MIDVSDINYCDKTATNMKSLFKPEIILSCLVALVAFAYLMPMLPAIGGSGSDTN